ncbi:MAG: ABC transporter permease subunit [Lachnospiraceae bacterium]|nr:ABC transporter permease subunit [Lachnospiraceae bacterium]
MRINPVYKREVTVSSRSARIPVIMMVFNSILALVAFLNMYSVTAQVKVTAEIQYSSFLDLYMFVASLEFVMLLFIMPALTSGSISGERERQTLELLLSTKATPWEIVTGKLMSSMNSMVLLVVSSFPVMALVFVYGGITIKDMGLLMLMYGTVALFSASLGICFSSICRRSTMATAMSYGVLTFLIAGTFVINYFVASMASMGAAGYANQMEGITSQVNSGVCLYLLLLNPAVSFYQIMSGQAGSREASVSVTQWFGSRSPNMVLDAWLPVSIGLQLLLAVLFLLIAVRAVDPTGGRRSRHEPKTRGTHASGKE